MAHGNSIQIGINLLLRVYLNIVIYDKFNVCGLLNNVKHDERNAIDIPVFPY